MAKKVFKGKTSANVELTIIEEHWLDDDTYVIVFDDVVDCEGETFHLEVEYHKDEDRVTFTSVYEYENVEGTPYLNIGAAMRNEITEYALKQVGVVNGMLSKQKIAIELTLDIDPTMTIGELHEWLKDGIEIKVNSRGGKARPIKVENLGWIKS